MDVRQIKLFHNLGSRHSIITLMMDNFIISNRYYVKVVVLALLPTDLSFFNFFDKLYGRFLT